MNGLYGQVNLKTFQWAVCKLEELQKLFDHPDPIDCLGFPYNRPSCDECESTLVDCIMNCGGDSVCTSTCNRDHAACLESCKWVSGWILLREWNKILSPNIWLPELLGTTKLADYYHGDMWLLRCISRNFCLIAPFIMVIYRLLSFMTPFHDNLIEAPVLSLSSAKRKRQKTTLNSKMQVFHWPQTLGKFGRFLRHQSRSLAPSIIES